MPQFLADIAGMLELFAIAAGLVLLHRAAKDGPTLPATVARELVDGGEADAGVRRLGRWVGSGWRRRPRARGQGAGGGARACDGGGRWASCRPPRRGTGGGRPGARGRAG